MTVIKVTICGDAKVGKSSIFNRYIYNTFSDHYISTIGAYNANVDVGNDTILRISDTAGKEKYRDIPLIYLRSTDAVVLVYDNSTRTGLQKWFDHCNSLCPKGTPMFLVRNKRETEKSDDNDTTFLPQKYQFVETDAKMWPESPNNLFYRVLETVRDAKLHQETELHQEESCMHPPKQSQDRYQTMIETLADCLQIKEILAEPTMQALKRVQTIKIGDITKLTDLVQQMPMSVYRGIKSHIIPQSSLDLACRKLTERDEPTVFQQLESLDFSRFLNPLELVGNKLTSFMDSCSLINKVLKKVLEQKKWAETEKCAQIDEKVLSEFLGWLKKSEMTLALWSAVEEGFLPGSVLRKSMESLNV